MTTSTRGQILKRPHARAHWLDFVDYDQLLRNGGLILGSSGTGKSDLGMYVVQQLQQKGVTVYVIDPSQAWPRQSNVGLFVRVPANLKTKIYNRSTILDTSDLAVEDQKEFIESLCEVLYRYSVKNPQSRSWKMIVLEEAQLVYFQGSLRSHRLPFSKMLLTVGRNYGLRFLAISQFASEIDKLLVKMSGQRWFGWTWEKNDRDYLKAFLGETVQELKRLKNGEFLFHDPRRDLLKKIKVQPYKQNIRPRLLTELISERS